jgi:threonine/homoserine/homoserine lactone efflux protein
MGRQAWGELGIRLEARLIRSVDLASILFFDAVILLFGYLVIWGVDAVADQENQFFRVAKMISHGAFVLLYLFWVAYDSWEFWQESSRSNTNDSHRN